MSSLKKVESKPQQKSEKKVVVTDNDDTVTSVNSKVNEDEEDEEDDGEEEDEEDDDELEGAEDGKFPIDLSENEVYRGICTLLEDEDGNNILEYISLLHTELIGINKSLENLKSIRKDISRVADCAEAFFKAKKSEAAVVSVAAAPPASSKAAHVEETPRKKKSSSS